MSKKRLILSFTSMVLSILTFVIATFAWLAVSQEVSQSPFNLDVSPGIFTDYQVHYFTQENVFRLSDSYNAIFADSTIIEKYDSPSDTWIIPSYSSSSEIGSFDGVLMKQYDPEIEANNFYNNLIMEIYFTYDVEPNTTVNVAALIDSTLAGTLPDDIEDRDPHYLSEALNIQHTSFDGITTYAFGVGGRTETTNLYASLSALFSDDVTYPKSDFGSTPADINFGNMVLSGTGSRYVYFNFSYNADYVTPIYTARASTPTYYFYEDDNPASDIMFIDYVVDTVYYVYAGSGIYTRNSIQYTIDQNGNLIGPSPGYEIVINAENLYPNEHDAHAFTDFIRFYTDIKLSISW